MSVPNYQPGPTTTGFFQGDLFKNIDGTYKNITLKANDDFITEIVLEIGSTVLLEIPTTTSLEIESYVDQSFLSNNYVGNSNVGTEIQSTQIQQSLTLPQGQDFIIDNLAELNPQQPLEIPNNSSLEITQSYVYGKTSVATPQIMNPYKFSVYRAGAWTDGNATFVLVTFDTEIFDTGLNYSTATGKFTATVAGTYWFAAGTTSSITTTNQKLTSIYINGATSIQGNQIGLFGGTDNILAIATGIIYMNVGDYAQIYSYGAGGVGVATSYGTYFQGFLVSQ